MAMEPNAFSNPLLDDVEAFCRALRPIEGRCYLERRWNDQLVPLARQHDLLGMTVPHEYGGRDADAVSYARALARIGREGTGVRTFFSGHSSLGQYAIRVWGDADQRQRYLPPSARGELLLAFALTEPEAGSNPRELKTTYRRDGDAYVLEGSKYLISNGGVADLIVTFAYPAGGSGRMSAFLVNTHARGFEAQSLEPKVGNVTADTVQFLLTDCRVPAWDLLGVEGEGLRIAMATLVSGRLSVAAGCLGVIEDCLDEAVTYAQGRQQHGKPIARHQLVQEHIAAIEMARVTTESLVYRAALLKAESEAYPEDEDVRFRVDLLAAQAKLYASQAACEAADRAVQVFGGRGFLDAYRPGRHLKDTRVCRIYEGTDEILKLKIAAAILGKEFEAFT
jgi:alkylation response protein AidB-like acyl-CoA dehydrogenase